MSPRGQELPRGARGEWPRRDPVPYLEAKAAAAVAAQTPPARLLPCPGPVAPHPRRSLRLPCAAARCSPPRAARPQRAWPGRPAEGRASGAGPSGLQLAGCLSLPGRSRRHSATGVPASGSDGPTPAQNSIVRVFALQEAAAHWGSERALQTPTPQKVLARGTCPGLKESNSVLDGNLPK